MNKNTPLVTAILGAIALVLQQYIGNAQGADLKVVGFAVLIAALGVISTFLKGKGASFGGILGAVLYTFVTLAKDGLQSFSWTQFIITAAFAALAVIAPTAIPQPADPKEE